MELAKGDHRAFRPAGWIEAGLEKLERVLPIAERAGLTPIQLACQWNLAHPAVECVAPTLIQEAGPEARPIEEKRAELAALPAEQRLSRADVAAIRAIGDNTGCMALKGASPAHEGEERPDRWALSEELAAVGGRWGIDPERDLAPSLRSVGGLGFAAVDAVALTKRIPTFPHGYPRTAFQSAFCHPRRRCHHCPGMSFTSYLNDRIPGY